VCNYSKGSGDRMCVGVCSVVGGGGVGNNLRDNIIYRHTLQICVPCTLAYIHFVLHKLRTCKHATHNTRPRCVWHVLYIANITCIYPPFPLAYTTSCPNDARRCFRWSLQSHFLRFVVGTETGLIVVAWGVDWPCN